MIALMNTLYTVNTTNGQRASIALEECEIGYAAQMVDLQTGEHRSEAMLRLNPFGRMPVLEHEDGTTIYGSMAIALHAARQSGRLLPPEPERDAFDEWLGIIMSDLGPAFSGQFYFGVLAPERFEWGINLYEDVIARYLAAIDAHLESSEFFLPSGYSLADVLFYPTAKTSVARMPGGLDPYPNIARWETLVGAREPVRRGMAASS